jgi:hypothetical protein
MKNSRLSLAGVSTLTLWDQGAIQHFGYSPDIGNNADYLLARMLAKRNGHLRDYDVVKNMIVDDGLELVIDLLLDLDTGLSYHAVGTDDTTAAIGDTELGAEHTRRAWAHSSRTSQAGYYSVFYLASEVNIVIEEAGVFGGSGASATADSGTLFSHYLQSYDNSGGSPLDLTFDWNVEAARG